VGPQSTQTLPRVVTFNAEARALEQAPAEELEALRGPPASSRTAVRLAPGAAVDLEVGSGVSRHSETVAVFRLPEHNATFGVAVGDLKCTVSYVPPAGEAASKPWYAVQVECGGVSDTLRLVASETTVEVRVFADATFVEAYFQKGRVAMTVSAKLDANSQIAVESTAPVTVSDSRVYPMRSIWVSPQEVRSAPRVFPGALRAASRGRGGDSRLTQNRNSTGWDVGAARSSCAAAAAEMLAEAQPRRRGVACSRVTKAAGLAASNAVSRVYKVVPPTMAPHIIALV
jgi:hypothetical protein